MSADRGFGYPTRSPRPRKARLVIVTRSVRLSSIKFIVGTRGLAVLVCIATTALAIDQLVGSPAHLDRALYTLGGGAVAALALWFFSLGYEPFVFDDGDALVVGRKRTRIPLSRISSVSHKIPEMRGGRAYTEVTSNAAPRGSFGYIPRDLTTGPTSVPEPPSTRELRMRVEQARAQQAPPS